MAKKTGLKDALGVKQALPKKIDLEVNRVENAIKKIHKKPSAKKIRVSIDIPEHLYIKMKEKTQQEGKTVRGYFLSLLRDDIE